MSRAPEFDPSEPHNTCFGDGDAKFSQNGWYYDAHFNPLERLPTAPDSAATRALREKQAKANTAPATSIELPIGPVVRKGAKTPILTLAEVRGENAAAAAAEEHAE